MSVIHLQSPYLFVSHTQNDDVEILQKLKSHEIVSNYLSTTQRILISFISTLYLLQYVQWCKRAYKCCSWYVQYCIRLTLIGHQFRSAFSSDSYNEVSGSFALSTGMTVVSIRWVKRSKSSEIFTSNLLRVYVLSPYPHHLSPGKMTAISQMIFSDAFSWMQILYLD